MEGSERVRLILACLIIGVQVLSGIGYIKLILTCKRYIMGQFGSAITFEIIGIGCVVNIIRCEENQLSVC